MASAYNRADEVNWDRCLHQMALQSSVSQTDDKAIRTMFSVSCLAISYGIQWKSYRCYIPYVSYKARNFSRVANLCNDKSLTPAVENFLQVSQSNPSLPPSLWLPFWSPDPSSPHTSGCPQMPIWSQRPYLLPDRQGKGKACQNLTQGQLTVEVVHGWVIPWNTYNGLAVLVEGGFDKQGPESKAEGTVCVADAQLPAWGAALKHHTKHMRTMTPTHLHTRSLHHLHTRVMTPPTHKIALSLRLENTAWY